jgi:hypothetical protein
VTITSQYSGQRDQPCVEVVDIQLYQRRHSTTRMRSTALRLCGTAIAVVLLSIVSSSIFHLDVELVHNRLVLVYPGSASPGETVLSAHRDLGTLVALGPATVSVSPIGSTAYLAVNGMTTTWQAPANMSSVTSTIGAGYALVEIGTSLYQVPVEEISLATPL